MPEYTCEELRQIATLEFRSLPTGSWYTSRNGRRVQETKGTEFATTAVGKFELSEWTRLSKEAILREKGQDVLRKVCGYCREHCAWLHTEKEVEAYAVSCIVSGAYAYWKGLEICD